MSYKLRSVTRRSALGLAAAFLVLQRHPVEAESSAILVHKDPNCSCCTGWVRHLKDAGFAVTAQETTDLQPIRKRLEVPADLAAYCRLISRMRQRHFVIKSAPRDRDRPKAVSDQNAKKLA